MKIPLYPTSAQTLTCFIRCQQITSLLLPIYMVRLDERTGEIYILARENLGIIITRDGNWSFDE